MSILILKRNQNLLKIAFTYSLTVYVWVSATVLLGGQRATLGVSSLLSPCKSQGLNSYQVGDKHFYPPCHLDDHEAPTLNIFLLQNSSLISLLKSTPFQGLRR